MKISDILPGNKVDREAVKGNLLGLGRGDVRIKEGDEGADGLEHYVTCSDRSASNVTMFTKLKLGQITTAQSYVAIHKAHVAPKLDSRAEFDC